MPLILPLKMEKCSHAFWLWSFEGEIWPLRYRGCHIIVFCTDRICVAILIFNTWFMLSKIYSTWTYIYMHNAGNKCQWIIILINWSTYACPPDEKWSRVIENASCTLNSSLCYLNIIVCIKFDDCSINCGSRAIHLELPSLLGSPDSTSLGKKTYWYREDSYQQSPLRLLWWL